MITLIKIWWPLVLRRAIARHERLSPPHPGLSKNHTGHVQKLLFDTLHQKLQLNLIKILFPRFSFLSWCGNVIEKQSSTPVEGLL